MPSPFDHLWPDWPDARLLHVDRDIVVVDKPAGTSTHAPDRARGDDVVTRVRRALAARERVPPERVYLAVHQALERDVSGALVLSRDKRANPALASALARGELHRVFVAAVAARALPTAARLPVRALRVLARTADRALLELDAGPTPVPALRAALARAGAPIAGDAAHPGAAPASRVMLHARALTAPHPATGAHATWTAEPPPALARWVAHGTADAPLELPALDATLADAADRRYALGHAAPDTDAFRLCNDAGDDAPGVTVDRYGDFALVQFYAPVSATERDAVLDAAARLGAAGVYAKFRPRQANTLADTRRDELAPAHALRGRDAPDPLVVRESGLAYRVRLGDGLSTGIFLDQRDNRARVRAMARGARVLNLFAYTCAFTVAAAAGGAAQTVSVDVSSGALAWGRDNLALNGLADEARHVFAAADVFGWLEGARARRDRFGLVLLDPPSYSTTKDGSRFSAESNYRDLAAHAYAVVAPGGALLACTNHRGVVRARFRRHLHEAARAAGRRVAHMRDLPDPEDFPPLPGREPHLKSVLVTLS